MGLKRCVSLANRFIVEQGFCILAYDVVGSSKMELGFFLETRNALRDDLNNRFKVYLHKGFETRGVRERFEIYRGDIASACVGSVEGVRQIINYHTENYGHFPVRWAVAKRYSDVALKRL
jgi:hypothetical protein